MKIKGITISINALIIAATLFAAFLFTFPFISKIPVHPDEHQFYGNAFSIMAGTELQNYLHVASTEYALAGFLTIANLFTDAGVNFPNGAPSNATYYFGHLFGAILYFLTYALGAIIIQKRSKQIELRTVIFTLLYFSSIAMFERFLRVNSDSFMIFLFLNFLILTLWQHLHKPSVIELFFLNTLFIFLATFTNLKAIYLMLPIIALNFILPFIWYEKAKKPRDKSLDPIYRMILYLIGVVVITLVLWKILIPQPYVPLHFWLTLKKTILHGTMFDFDYPGQSFKSGLVYLYDLVVYQIGLYTFGLILVFLVVCLNKKGSYLVNEFKKWLRSILNIQELKEGNLYKFTEVILLLSFGTYFFGVATRVVHWSRWGAPLGFIAIILLSILLEKLYELTFTSKAAKSMIVHLFPYCIIIAWLLRIFLVIDIYNSKYTIEKPYTITQKDIIKYLGEKGVPIEQAESRVTWFTGYTPDVNNMSFEQVVEKDNLKTQYMLWPHWNLGVVYADQPVDKSTHNQRAFIDKYAQNIEFRFPTMLSKQMHMLKKFAWSVLKISWTPETDSIGEAQYAALTLKKPLESIELAYTVPFKDLSHYESEHTEDFNSRTLWDSYLFPPCYSYYAVRMVSNGAPAPEANPILGPYGKTAGLYCHSLGFRVLPKGSYAIRVHGLPDEPNNMAYFNMGDFGWDPATKTAYFNIVNTVITGEFGIATPHKNLPQLQYEVYYVLNQEFLAKIDEAEARQSTASENTTTQ